MSIIKQTLKTPSGGTVSVTVKFPEGGPTIPIADHPEDGGQVWGKGSRACIIAGPYPLVGQSWDLSKVGKTERNSVIPAKLVDGWRKSLTAATQPPSKSIARKAK